MFFFFFFFFFLRRNLHKSPYNTEIYCQNYFVDDDDDFDGGCNDFDGGCNDNGDDNNGLFQFQKLVSSKMAIVSLKVFTVTV